MTLPQQDQPDNYTGYHASRDIRWVSFTTAPGYYTGHLYPRTAKKNQPFYDNRRPQWTTYCTTTNPAYISDLNGLTYEKQGRTANIRGGARLHELTTHLTNKAFKGKPVVWCEHCLTMLAVEAEMYGQRNYPIKGLLQQLDNQPTKS